MAFKEFDYKPRLKDEDGDLVFSGTCKIRVLDLETRMEKAKGMSLKIDQNGEMDIAGSADLVKKFISVAKENIISVNLKCGDVEIKDVNDLEYYEEGMHLLKEIGEVMVGGLKLGKPSAKKSKSS